VTAHTCVVPTQRSGAYAEIWLLLPRGERAQVQNAPDIWSQKKTESTRQQPHPHEPLNQLFFYIKHYIYVI